VSVFAYAARPLQQQADREITRLHRESRSIVETIEKLLA